MNVLLYLNTAERERLDKSSHLQLLFSLEGYLRAPSSIINPSMMIEFDLPEPMKIVNEDDAILADADNATITAGHARITEANYMYIPEFGRFYFITDIVVAKARQYIVTGSVDVLMSFKDYILDQTCYIERNEFYFSSNLQDELLPINFRKTVTETAVERGGLVNTDLKTSFSSDERFLVLTTSTNYSNIWLDDIIPPSGSGLPTIEPNSLIQYGVNVYACDEATIESLARASIADDSLPTFIPSLLAMPFVVAYDYATFLRKGNDTGNDNDSKIFARDGTALRGRVCKAMSEYQVIADFVFPQIRSFLDAPPYSRYELYIPFFGYTEIDIQQVSGHRLIVYFMVDYKDGSGNVYVYDMTSKRQVFSSACQIGIKIGLSTSNLRELTAQRNAENTNLALNILASAGSIAVGVASDNPVAVIGGILNSARAVTGYVNSNAMLFQKGQANFGSSSASLYAPMEVRLRITREASTISGDTDLERFAHVCGRPNRSIRLLSNLRGFTVAKSMRIENINCFARESDMIKELFATGVIL